MERTRLRELTHHLINFIHIGICKVEMERTRLRELLHDKAKIILTSNQYKTKNARLRELRINTLRVIDAFCVSTGKERR